MADISNIIYSKYVQATDALDDYAVKISSNLGSGIKSKARIRKFNLMSAWLDLLGAYIRKPENTKGTSVPSVIFSNFTPLQGKAGGMSVFIDIIDATGKYYLLMWTGNAPRDNYNAYNEVYKFLLNLKIRR